MVADMQAYEQQMVEGFLHPLCCPADTTKSAATANQRDLLSLQREAQALQDAEAQMQRDVEAAAEVTAEAEYLGSGAPSRGCRPYSLRKQVFLPGPY